MPNHTVKPTSQPQNHLDLSTLEQWLWDAACQIRGPLDAPKYKDYILPLIFLKRLSDVFDDEVTRLGETYGSQETATALVDADHSLVRFYLPRKARWSAIETVTTGLGQAITDAMRAVTRENPRLSGVIDVTDFNATTAGERIIGDEHLYALVQVLRRHPLGLDEVEPDILGRAYEYLLRKFAEGQGQSAGEFYTPRMVGVLMARLLDPEPGQTSYDPTCGSFGLQIKLHLRLLEKYGEQVNSHRRLPPQLAPLKLYGQEINGTTFAMARMNAFIHDLDAEIAIGDTMHKPAFLTPSGGLKTFDLITANPMWNQKFGVDVYENDPFGRFGDGIPPSSSGDWGWVQHMAASLSPRGRMAVILDTGAVSRGSGNQGSNKERDIRQKFVMKDWIEAVILLPENLFYNTTAPGIVMMVNKAKRHPGEIMLVNASREFTKGRPKNEMGEEHVAHIGRLVAEWSSEEGYSAVIPSEEIARNDFTLSSSRYVAQNGQEEVLPLEEAVILLQEAEEERSLVDNNLNKILGFLGLGNYLE
jgi:type I restriction enzyme M protein